MGCFAHWQVILLLYLAYNAGFTATLFSSGELARISFRVWTSWLLLAVFLVAALPIHLGMYCWLYLGRD